MPQSDPMRSEVQIILRRRDHSVLLGERRNTGFGDGFWYPPAGRVNEGESASAAVIRETEEKVGVTIHPAAVHHVHTMHHNTEGGRVALFFEVPHWSGEVVNKEPQNYGGWNWFPLIRLPEMIPYTHDGILNYLEGVTYSERGWF